VSGDARYSFAAVAFLTVLGESKQKRVYWLLLASTLVGVGFWLNFFVSGIY
jgi:NO-binding membrane sensor protein with MHYT domain